MRCIGVEFAREERISQLEQHRVNNATVSFTK